ncbi:MAG TPA: hypothetical protein VGD56_15615 [Gemmatirosa sp.]
MSEFLVPDDRRPAPRPTGRAAGAVRVTSVPGGVRLTVAPAGDRALTDEIAAALAGVVERERRDEGGFVRVTVAEHSDGAAVSLTITGPLGFHAPTAALGRVLVRHTPLTRL